MAVSTPFMILLYTKKSKITSKACEDLLSSTTNLSYVPLSLKAREVMEQYAEELQKRLLIPPPNE